MGKVPPSAIELEEAVLGVVLLEKRAFDEVSEILTEDNFYSDAHRKIFAACSRLAQKYMPIDMLTVVEELKRTGDLEAVGGPFYVSKITLNVSYSSVNLETHARIVLEKSISRNMITICGEALNNAYDETVDIFSLINEHEKNFTKINLNLTKERIYQSEELAAEMLDQIAFLMENKKEMTGISTGFPQLDIATNGWQPTDLIILAARPSVGKTAFALNVLRNAAEKEIPVAFFSLEMSSKQLIARIMSAESEIKLENILNGRLSKEEFARVSVVADKIAAMPIFIDDTAALNIYEFRSKARRLVRKNKVGMIIIDYLQLMSAANDKGNREQEISLISRNLKILAKELNIPIIALSQLSRAPEKRDNKMPILSDLRESGAIEQDADIVMFLYRPEYYDIKADEIGESTQNDGLIKIAKHRNGALEILKFKTDLSIQRWYDHFDWENLQRNKQQARFVPLDNHYQDDNPF